MKSYRLLQTDLAVQYLGEPIPDVTCDGDITKHGCDSSRRQLPHVHTMATGGMTCLQVSDWILPVPGGPFAVFSDGKFRGRYEVPEEAPAEVEPDAAPLVLEAGTGAGAFLADAEVKDAPVKDAQAVDAQADAPTDAPAAPDTPKAQVKAPKASQK